MKILEGDVEIIWYFTEMTWTYVCLGVVISHKYQLCLS